MTMILRDSIRLVRNPSASLAVAVILSLSAPAAYAQRAFPTPEEAAGALATAVKSGVRMDILWVLGPHANDIISSGDDVADAETRQRFTAAYDTKHSIKPEGDKKGVIIMGADDFPFPIPLMRKKAGWHLATVTGRLE